MRATEFRFQILVTIETNVIEGRSFDELVEEIRERIVSQVSGHRTPKRLATYARADFTRIVSEYTRELPE